MLQLFRKYQQYIFMVITTVVIITFTLGGSAGIMSFSRNEDPVAFVAVDGTKISRSQIDRIAYFIGTDAEEKRNYGGVNGPNFLNDGVISKNFVETGMLSVLAKQFSDYLAEDFAVKSAKEKKDSLYVHPQAKFIGTEGIWKHFLPGTENSYRTLTKAENPLDSEAFESRLKLFSAERKLPPGFKRYMLISQEKQYKGLEHDSTLDYADLSLFGYHRAEDWFGKKLMQLTAGFIINASIIAEQRGYVVTKEEALADLVRNAVVSFKQNEKSDRLNAENPSQYMANQLTLMGLDQNMAVSIWQKVLLFRRLFDETGSAVFVDSDSFKNYNAHAFEGVKGTIYRLPEELRFADPGSLAKFESYLDGVADRPKEDKKRQDLPKKFKTVAQIEKTAPELLFKQYLLNVAEISKPALASQVSLKDTWQKQTTENFWKKLEVEFPELALSKAENTEQRFAALDTLDNNTRTRVDTFTRLAILDESPDKMRQALDKAPSKKMTVDIPLNGGKIFVKGNTDRKQFMTLLDIAPLGSDPKGPLNYFTADHKHYYRIEVLDKSATSEIMTFAEANKSGVLDERLDKTLKTFYENLKIKNPGTYVNSDQTPKPFSEVSTEVTEEYYKNFIASIEEYAKSVSKDNVKGNMTPARAASLRFLKYFEDAKKEYVKNPVDKEKDSDSELASGINKLPARKAPEMQWDRIARPYETTRGSKDTLTDKNEVLSLNPGEASKVYTPVNGDIFFFIAKEKTNAPEDKIIAKQVGTVSAFLGDEAEVLLTEKLIGEMQKKNGLHLGFIVAKTPDEQIHGE